MKTAREKRKGAWEKKERVVGRKWVRGGGKISTASICL